MATTGLLTTKMPTILGSDFSGVVVETGEGCTRIKNGDSVYGLSRLGRNEFSPFQETFLVDEDICFKNDGTLSPEGASTVGVALLVCHRNPVVVINVDGSS